MGHRCSGDTAGLSRFGTTLVAFPFAPMVARKKSLASLYKDPAQLDMGSALAVLDGIAETQSCEKAIKDGNECMASLLGSWKGAESDCGLVESQADWVIQAQKGIHEGKLATWCLEPAQVAVGRLAVTNGVKELDTALQSHGVAVTEWKKRLQLDESCLPDGPLSTERLNLVLRRWEAQAAAIDKLHSLVAFNQISAECGPAATGECHVRCRDVGAGQSAPCPTL